MCSRSHTRTIHKKAIENSNNYEERIDDLITPETGHNDKQVKGQETSNCETQVDCEENWIGYFAEAVGLTGTTDARLQEEQSIVNNESKVCRMCYVVFSRKQQYEEL